MVRVREAGTVLRTRLVRHRAWGGASRGGIGCGGRLGAGWILSVRLSALFSHTSQMTNDPFSAAMREQLIESIRQSRKKVLPADEPFEMREARYRAGFAPVAAILRQLARDAGVVSYNVWGKQTPLESMIGLTEAEAYRGTYPERPQPLLQLNAGISVAGYLAGKYVLQGRYRTVGKPAEMMEWPLDPAGGNAQEVAEWFVQRLGEFVAKAPRLGMDGLS